MGFSSSVATAIILFAALVCAAMYLPVSMDSTEEQALALEQQEDAKIDVENTEIVVSMESCTDPVEVTATNDGTTSWKLSDMDVLLDGVYYVSEQYEVAVNGDAEQTLVMPGETATFTIDGVSADQGKIVTEYGVADIDVCD